MSIAMILLALAVGCYAVAVLESWAVHAARLLRAEDLNISPAHVI